MALAAPGQILLEESGLVKEDREHTVRLPKGPPSLPESHEPVELELLGNYYLKVSTISIPYPTSNLDKVKKSNNYLFGNPCNKKFPFKIIYTKEYI